MASQKTTWRFLVIEDADGRRGFGECTASAVDAQVAPRAHDLCTALEGLEPNDDTLQRLKTVRDESFAGAAVFCAADQAIHDLRAQAEGISLARCLGARKDEVSLYANINRRTEDRAPDGFRRSAQRAVEKDFRVVKLAPFDGLSPGVCGSPEGRGLIHAALDRIRAVAEVMPSGGEIYVDAHWRLTPGTAVDILPALAASRATWFECPLPETTETIKEIAAIRRAANAHGLRLAGCENFTGTEGFAPFIDAGAYDVVMPDVKYAGGLREIQRIADLAHRNGTEVSPHNPTGPICHAASLHLMAALDSEMHLEVQFEESDAFDVIVDGDLPPRHGRSRLPRGHGLGIALTEDICRKASDAALSA